MPQSYVFDKSSMQRASDTVRRVEGMPRKQNVGNTGARPLIPFNIQQFKLVDTWDANSDEQFAKAYRLYWDDTDSEYKEDTSTEYTVYTSVIESWDLYANNESSPTKRDVVIAYHRHDSDRWEVLHRNQNMVRTAKVYEDWAEPTGTDIFPTVSVELWNDDTKATITDPFDVQIPIAWDGTNFTKPAPELFADDYCQVTINMFGFVQVSSPIAFSFLRQSVDWTGSVTNIPDGWVLEDGSALPADKKVSESNAPDTRGRFIVGVDPADSAGDGSENNIGDTGGNRVQQHRHAIAMTTISSGGVTSGSDFNVWKRDVGSAYTSGVDDLATPVNEYNENRPPYYAKAKIWRYK